MFRAGIRFYDPTAVPWIVMIATAVEPHHRVDFGNRVDIAEILCGRAFTNFRRAWYGNTMELHSDLYILSASLLNLIFLINSLETLRLDNSSRWRDKFSVIRNGFCDLSSYFRWVYHLLGYVFYQRLKRPTDGWGLICAGPWRSEAFVWSLLHWHRTGCLLSPCARGSDPLSEAWRSLVWK